MRAFDGFKAHLVAFVAALGIFFGLSSAVDAQERYLLQKGDRISVSVMEDPGLDQTSLIRPDGLISVPIAGAVTAAGRTPEQLQSTIASRLSSTFAVRPTVTVALLERFEEPEELPEEEIIPVVYVLGQVGAPGTIPMKKPLSLLQALAIAGGPGAFAATDRISVRRGTGDAEIVTTFNYEAVEDGGAVGGNIELVEGDVIIVPERGLFD